MNDDGRTLHAFNETPLGDYCADCGLPKSAPVHGVTGVTGVTGNTRLGRITQAMLDAYADHPEKMLGDKILILANDGVVGGTRLYNYDDEMDAAVDMIQHLRAILGVRGMDLQIHTMPNTNPENN